MSQEFAFSRMVRQLTADCNTSVYVSCSRAQKLFVLCVACVPQRAI